MRDYYLNNIQAHEMVKIRKFQLINSTNVKAEGSQQKEKQPLSNRDSKVI